MGKPAAPPRQAENESRAVARLLRVSPQKLNLVAQSIRGLHVEDALAELQFSPKRIAKDVRKCLQSAVDNAENNHNLNIDELVVAQAHVGKNIVMRRMVPRARGRGVRIEKHFSQITILLRQTDGVQSAKTKRDERKTAKAKAAKGKSGGAKSKAKKAAAPQEAA